MTSTETPRRTPSVSELQAALLAARNGQFASVPPRPEPQAGTAPLPPTPASVGDVDPPEASSLGPAPSGGQGVWLVGTHGGSGARCLSAVLPGTRHAGKQWPVPSGGCEPVVLVCRGNQRGLSSAQDYARRYRDGELTEALHLLGVIVSADAPGRVPAPLRRLERLLSGAVPILGRVPWESAWRLGPPVVDPASPPPWIARLSSAIGTPVRA